MVVSEFSNLSLVGNRLGNQAQQLQQSTSQEEQNASKIDPEKNLQRELFRQEKTSEIASNGQVASARYGSGIPSVAKATDIFSKSLSQKKMKQDLQIQQSPRRKISQSPNVASEEYQLVEINSSVVELEEGEILIQKDLDSMNLGRNIRKSE